MNQDLRNAYPALAVLAEANPNVTAHLRQVTVNGAPFPPAATTESRMTYRRDARRTRFAVAVLTVALFGIAWCQERKR